MKYKDAIFLSIAYIEKNIKEELTLEMIAETAGYSPYHFSRIFHDQMGISIMEYVKERRLICASKELLQGKKIIDVSIEYGYKTHSGFSKAFKKKFGFTPTQHLIYAIHVMNLKGERMYMNEYPNPFLQPTVDFMDPEKLYQDLLGTIQKNDPGRDLSPIEEAYHFACKVHQGQLRKSGEPYIIHPLCVAIILAEVEIDLECIAAGLLHDVAEDKESDIFLALEKQFLAPIPQLVKDVVALHHISFETFDDRLLDQRVILIKLADRLHNMRTIRFMHPDRRKEKAKETLEIFSPIAARHGVSKIKTELDDLSLMYL